MFFPLMRPTKTDKIKISKILNRPLFLSNMEKSFI